MTAVKASVSLRHRLVFRSFGVTVEVRCNDAAFVRLVLQQLPSAFGEAAAPADNVRTDFKFDVVFTVDDTCEILKNGEQLGEGIGRSGAMGRLMSELRLTIAEHAVDHVFVHAGAVGWKGKGIIIPARSFKGKTSLTAALVRLGARYYSDEFAILDKRGRLRPFSKHLSLRGRSESFEQVDHPVESIGGKAGKRPIPVRLIVLTEFKKNAEWKPTEISAGAAAMDVLDHTVPIRRDPRFVLPVISRVTADAITLRSNRGDAESTAKSILAFVDELERT